MTTMSIVSSPRRRLQGELRLSWLDTVNSIGKAELRAQSLLNFSNFGNLLAKFWGLGFYSCQYEAGYNCSVFWYWGGGFLVMVHFSLWILSIDPVMGGRSQTMSHQSEHLALQGPRDGASNSWILSTAHELHHLQKLELIKAHLCRSQQDALSCALHLNHKSFRKAIFQRPQFQEAQGCWQVPLYQRPIEKLSRVMPFAECETQTLTSWPLPHRAISDSQGKSASSGYA